MPFTTKTEVNGVNQTAKIEFFVNGESVAQFLYDNKVYTLPARPLAILIPPTDLKAWLLSINRWLSVIQNDIAATNGGLTEVSSEIKKETGRVEMDGTIRGVSFGAEWSGGDVELKPRLELSITRDELQWFVRQHEILTHLL